MNFGSTLVGPGNNKGLVNSEFNWELIIGDGVSTITTGVQGYFRIPYNVVITGFELVGDVASGSIVLDLWKDTYANFPPLVADTVTGTEKPTISAAQKAQDVALGSWTTSWSKGDWFAVNVDSITTFKKVTLVLIGYKAA